MRAGIVNASIGGLCALALVVLSACAPGGDRDEMVVLTVAGAVEAPNRDGFDPETDRYLAWLGADFSAARTFTRMELARLPQTTLHTLSEALPAGAWEGPLLADVLERAQARADAQTVVARAMDGYSALIPIAEARESGAILALRRDGVALGVGGHGPAMIVFPDTAEASPDWYVWGLVLLSVE